MALGVYRDTLRLNDAQRRNLITVLNSSADDVEANDLRRCERYPYFVAEGLPVEMSKDGRTLGTFLISPRNLSVGGLSFLHGTYLYPGTDCIIRLRTRSGAHQKVVGDVVHCRCVDGRIHEVGVAFRRPINIDAFVDTALPLEAPPDVAYDAVELAILARRLQEQAFCGASREDIYLTIRELVNVVRRGNV